MALFSKRPPERLFDRRSFAFCRTPRHLHHGSWIRAVHHTRCGAGDVDYNNWSLPILVSTVGRHMVHLGIPTREGWLVLWRILLVVGIFWRLRVSAGRLRRGKWTALAVKLWPMIWKEITIRQWTADFSSVLSSETTSFPIFVRRIFWKLQEAVQPERFILFACITGADRSYHPFAWANTSRVRIRFAGVGFRYIRYSSAGHLMQIARSRLVRIGSREFFGKSFVAFG